MAPGDQAHENRDSDRLGAEEIVPTSGAWSGLLFDNPVIGLPAALTWTFTVSCADVEREFGSSPVSLSLDWVPLPNANWFAMAGQSASCARFGEPIECSAYFFEHYGYDAAQMKIVAQDNTRVRVQAHASGDNEGLGVPRWSFDQWLEFEGIYVQLDGVETVADASAALRRFTDPTGLTAVNNDHNIHFVVADHKSARADAL